MSFPGRNSVEPAVGTEVPDRVGWAHLVQRLVLGIVGLAAAVAAMGAALVAEVGRSAGRLVFCLCVAMLFFLWRAGRTSLTLAFASGRYAIVGDHQLSTLAHPSWTEPDRELTRHWIELLDVDGGRPPLWVEVDADQALVLLRSQAVAVWGDGGRWMRCVLNGPTFTVVPTEVRVRPPDAADPVV